MIPRGLKWPWFLKRDSANQKEFFTQLKFIFTKFSQNFKDV